MLSPSDHSFFQSFIITLAVYSVKEMTSVQYVINDCSADIITLMETWLTSKISNAELFSCKDKYLIYRSDRGNRTGGGVLLAVKECYECFCIPISSELEAIWCCVKVILRKLLWVLYIAHPQLIHHLIMLCTTY